jgi:phytoene dehydrogenase-like protein
MNNIYDYILIGAGPTNLTIATFCSIYKKKCLILEKENEIGGCHRVIRENGFLTEHGPRVYSSSFINFISILKLLDINFDDLFIKYNYTVNDINKIIF